MHSFFFARVRGRQFRGRSSTRVLSLRVHSSDRTRPLAYAPPLSSVTQVPARTLSWRLPKVRPSPERAYTTSRARVPPRARARCAACRTTTYFFVGVLFADPRVGRRARRHARALGWLDAPDSAGRGIPRRARASGVAWRSPAPPSGAPSIHERAYEKPSLPRTKNVTLYSKWTIRRPALTSFPSPPPSSHHHTKPQRLSRPASCLASP